MLDQKLLKIFCFIQHVQLYNNRQLKHKLYLRKESIYFKCTHKCLETCKSVVIDVNYLFSYPSTYLAEHIK